ncbi:unnamed protein product [Blepharisma stoltei]|uniref:Uncharacterized protein n=1 Tax=Blepharisma stoltei TaxID=1481888 RepID=A0AAU9KB55_9CILI|nr:unnamed protein product [Blepharisma stoltei]
MQCENADENLSTNQGFQQCIPKINHKIQIISAEIHLIQNFRGLLQNSISFISERSDEYYKEYNFSYHYWYFRKCDPTTTLDGIKFCQNDIKLIECLNKFCNSPYNNADHFLASYNVTVLCMLDRRFNYFAMLMTDEQLMKISEVIEELGIWSSEANYDMKIIYQWIKGTYLKILAFRAKSQSENTIEEIDKKIVLKQEEEAHLQRELQNVINFN